MDNENKKYHAYEFKNPLRLVKLINVDVEKHTSVEIPDNTGFYYVDSLF